LIFLVELGVCEKFPDDEAHAGLEDLLAELVEDDFFGDRYTQYSPGFYTAKFELIANFSYPDNDVCLQIESIEDIK
jgi:hypothetical protein